MAAIKSAKGSHLLRRGRYSKPGYYYFITTATYQKRRIFIEPVFFEIIYNSLKWLEKEGRLELYFLIAMPDHLHLVFKLEQGETLSGVMGSFKGYTGKRIKQILEGNTPVWQSQYYDHLIRKDEDYFEIMRYCWYNPVRAGIVDEPKDYKFWWCSFEL